MNTHRAKLRWPLRIGAAAAFLLATGMPALADGPVPDPPVPTEAVPHARADSVIYAHAGVGDREPDCRCSVLHTRDIESRVDGHVERWAALSRAAAQPRHKRTRHTALHGTSFVEGVVGFPMRQFRLAADDDGAGNR
jgi:hypothetical protein